ncbi:uncharacterized protein BYT42DRAFT_506324 [Radiomyces spectabilis]|uniref:uncharacterized protein n=1 Tax=Radiomyces spectabilis TaxID=64574 RepID=UPI00221EB268|nr:uncharacterized protein BYT42DRAFT_506324 [Radiomyces spectabilis]KAI8364677.1 hypothetical protein BYT42DRAFT_506324 [Radiomyces spectabilis]
MKFDAKEAKAIGFVKLPRLMLGDYVEAFRHSRSYSGIVVEQKTISGQSQQVQVLLRNGKIGQFHSDIVAFAVPGFAQSSFATRYLKEPHEFDPTAAKMTTIPPQYIRAIKEYQQSVRYQSASILGRMPALYSHFIEKAPADSEQIDVSIEDLTKFAFNLQDTPSSLQIHAMFSNLVTDNVHFMASLNVRGTGRWLLRPKNEAQNLRQIIEWIRRRDTSYNDFLDRIKKIVEYTHAHADPKLGTFSSAARDLAYVQADNLTETDRKFVDFVVDWVKSPQIAIATPHDIFVPTILKSLKAYDDTFVDRTVAVQFLRDIGMFKPWDNVSLVENAAVAGEFLYTKRSKQNEQKMEMYTDIFLKRGNEELSAAGFYADDPCESIRKDFGDMPVYTIDDPSAKEIDDGISIERIPGEDSAWLHIHIADPSAYIPPTHELADLMQKRVQTLYLPERHLPILPDTLSSQKFSLGLAAQTARNRKDSQYAMTFSAKLDKEGHLSEWRITPSIVKNVIKLYYDDVDKLLLPHAHSYKDPLVDLSKSFCHPTSIVFDPSEDESSSSTLKKEYEKDLLDLFNLSNQHARVRRSNGAIMFSKPSPVISIHPSPLDLPNIRFSSPHFATSLPTIKVSLDKSAFSPARQMVAEMMIMGGRAASQYAAENGVPIPYRAQVWDYETNPEAAAIRQEMLDYRDPATGVIKFQQMSKYVENLPPAGITMTPRSPHAVMGIPDGYTKATSPLRRYLDIVVHWQLKAHLTKQKTPFTAEELEVLGPRVEARQKQLAILQQRSTQYWVIELLRRLQAESHGEDMEWTYLVNFPDVPVSTGLGMFEQVAVGTICELGVRGRIQQSNRKFQVGDILKVRIKSLDPRSTFVDLVPI